jgi:hypothetical protein
VPLKPDMPKRPTNMEYKCCAMSRRHISLKRKQTRIVAFQFLDEDEHVHARSKWIPFHMIFDVKCNPTHKAQYIAGGHWMETPTQITYSSVVTWESVRIAFFIAALNELDILAADIGNAYLQAPVSEQVHTTPSPEFGPSSQGQSVIVVRAIYGLKSSGAAWHAQLSETLYSMNFKPSLADPDDFSTMNNYLFMLMTYS